MQCQSTLRWLGLVWHSWPWCEGAGAQGKNLPIEDAEAVDPDDLGSEIREDQDRL